MMARVSMTVPQYRRRECMVDGRIERLAPALIELLALLLVARPDVFVEPLAILETLWPHPDLQPVTAPNIVGVYLTGLRKIGVTIDSRIGPGRGHRSLAGWRVPVEGRAIDRSPQMAVAA